MRSACKGLIVLCNPRIAARFAGKCSGRYLKWALRNSLMQPLGHFYGYETAAIQGISPANAAISPSLCGGR
jgi:hypothetical protein